MSVPRRLVSWLGSDRVLILLGVLAPLGMLAISAVMLLELRRDAWDKAEQTSKNLLQVIERDIARNVEIIDLSLHAVIENLNAPGVRDVSPDLRQLILFDRAVSAQDLGVMLVLDEHGDSILDAAGWPARQLNNSDRPYFKAHKAGPDQGLRITGPLTSRLTGRRAVVLSRRIDKPDGSFGGVALGTLALSYFDRLFDRIELGALGAINLYHRDGTRITRYPAAGADTGPPVATDANIRHFAAKGRGSAVKVSARDGLERLYTFTQVGDLPLILSVTLATREIEAEWRMRALGIGAVVVVLCGLTAGLSLLFGRELRRRAAVETELARLSRTDALTGLANRRCFEEAFSGAWDRAARSGGMVALLIVDADHFKRINDRHGHAAGDAVLRDLAGAMKASVHRPADLAARVGGEEFAVLLPDTDTEGAARVAEIIREAVSHRGPAASGTTAGAVTVSIGLAAARPAAAGAGDPAELYRRADAALYAAKAAGRNRTCCAPEPSGTRGDLRLVGSA